MSTSVTAFLSLLSGAAVGGVCVLLLWLIRKSSELYRTAFYVVVMFPGLLLSVFLFAKLMRILDAPRGSAGMFLTLFGTGGTITTLFLRRRFGIDRKLDLPPPRSQRTD